MTRPTSEFARRKIEALVLRADGFHAQLSSATDRRNHLIDELHTARRYREKIEHAGRYFDLSDTPVGQVSDTLNRETVSERDRQQRNSQRSSQHRLARGRVEKAERELAVLNELHQSLQSKWQAAAAVTRALMEPRPDKQRAEIAPAAPVAETGGE